MSSNVTVLDIGHTKVAAVAASREADGKIKLRGIGVSEHSALQKGRIVDPAGLASAVESALRRLQHATKSEHPAVIVGVGGSQVEASPAQGFIPIIPRSRSITREDVLQVINHSRQLMVPPGKEQIQVVPREFRIDSQGGIEDPVGLSGSRLEVLTLLVFADASHVEQLEKAVQAGGRKVAQMILRPLATALGVLTQAEIAQGAVAIDIGASHTELAVMKGGTVLGVGNVPVGIGHVASDLMQLLKVSREEAERLKLDHASAVASMVPESDTVQVHQIGQPQPRPMQRKVLCEIVESRTREIANLAKREIERIADLGSLTGGLVLTGGGARMPAMDRMFEIVFPHNKVRVAEPNLQGLVETRPGLAAAVGMARYALQVGEDEIAPAAGAESWKDRISRLISGLSGKA
jgi:cell division protein FtsA